MLGAPFRAGATHVVQFWPVAVAHVLDQVVNDAREVGADSTVLRAKPDNAVASMILIGNSSCRLTNEYAGRQTNACRNPAEVLQKSRKKSFRFGS
jgi:hypothetical protein